jgi:ADP-ribose pyrophosphatase YjhB (NUDIX family)
MIITKQQKGKCGMNNYNINDYERPSVAADVVTFGISTEESSNKRHSHIKKLKLLLIKRKEQPFAQQYALPGGFLRKGETIEQTALRELEEETGVENIKLINSGVYSAPDRDSRGWIISVSFLALSNTVSLKSNEASDAYNAQWFDFYYNESNDVIRISNSDEEFEIKYENGKALPNNLAFDHAQIIYDAFMRLKDEVIYHDIVFDLLPDLFPLSELQQIYTIITGIKEDAGNFRRKVKDKVEETDEFTSNKAHRPSKLYKKRVKEY